MKSNSEVILKNVLPFQPELLEGNVFLLLIEPENIPPHLGLIANGSYYSISVKGIRCGTDAANLISSLHKKSKKALFIQITDWKPNEKDLHNVFSSFSAPDGITVTCLSPILLALKDSLGNEVFECSFLFDLLPFLETRRKVGSVFHLGMHKQLKEGSFELVKYNLSDIRNCILDLKGEPIP